MSCFHPVLFANELATTPKRVCINGSYFVLWRYKKSINALRDCCKHRGAMLSQGTVVKANIECPYHGWQFDGKGACKTIPQKTKPYVIPKSCHMYDDAFRTYENDGIVWLNTFNENNDLKEGASCVLPLTTSWLKENCLITDYALDAQYSYWLQIENLLDPAHIHFVHNGFQGRKELAGPITINDLVVSESEISAKFTNISPTVPAIIIKFIIPSVVDVSILNKDNKTVRKNIIHVTPTGRDTCHVLFRDVAFKEFLLPNDPVVRLFDNVAERFVNEHYQFVNEKVVNAIMKQDIDVLTGQMTNIPDYHAQKYSLPTESDRLIVEFRKWAKQNKHIVA